MVRQTIYALAAVLFLVTSALSQSKNQITILYDAFGKKSSLQKDWGYAALIEYEGKKILFDSGNDPDIFARNVRQLGVDLRKLDFVVISHRHGDHTSGLTYLLKVNPTVKIYVPHEPFGLFGGDPPPNLYRDVEALPSEYRYFAGTHKGFSTGTPWPRAHFVQVEKTEEILPGVTLVQTISQTPGTLELHELTLSLHTSAGEILLTGCSHSGIENILEAAKAFNGKHVKLLVGGLHLVKAKDDEIKRIVSSLKENWRLDEIAPGHCTGEPAMQALREAFGPHLRYAGLGEVLPFQ
jgi:7,8-dihydropterin-6-yl-methyl-4-(beta-D-ribofuranosyl)aminobenzene 5'-phosphate synthase